MIFKSTKIVILLTVCFTIFSCIKKVDDAEIEKTQFHSYNYLLNEHGDTLIAHQFNLSDDGERAIVSAGNDILSVIAGYDRELRLYTSNFITTNRAVWDSIRTYCQIKYFTLEEMNLEYYDHDNLRVDEVVDFISNERNNVNKPPYKLEFLYNYTNPYNGRVYTNKVAKDKFLLEEYRFTHEAAGLKVKLDTIEKVEIRGYLQNGKWIETFRLKGNSAGYLHNERDWSDSMFVEGAFDLLFPANTFIFEQ